jgi:hypothetical protein
MGAKYLPTIRDQKASLRFHRKQSLLARPKKSSAPKAKVK